MKIANEILAAALLRVATTTPQASQPEPEVAYPPSWRRTVKSASRASGVSHARATAVATRVQLSRPSSPSSTFAAAQRKRQLDEVSAMRDIQQRNTVSIGTHR